MKGGDDPMKKNFGLEETPNKAMKDNAPMMRMDPSAMKAMGKPAPVKAMDKSALKKPLVGNQDRLPEALKKEILAK